MYLRNVSIPLQARILEEAEGVYTPEIAESMKQCKDEFLEKVRAGAI